MSQFTTDLQFDREDQEPPLQRLLVSPLTPEEWRAQTLLSLLPNILTQVEGKSYLGDTLLIRDQHSVELYINVREPNGCHYGIRMGVEDSGWTQRGVIEGNIHRTDSARRPIEIPSDFSIDELIATFTPTGPVIPAGPSHP